MNTAWRTRPWVLLMLLAAGSVAAQTTAIPVRAFFQNLEFTSVKISPDGKYLAVVGPIKGEEHKTQIDIVEIADMKVHAHYSLLKTFPVASGGPTINTCYLPPLTVWAGLTSRFPPERCGC